MYDFSAKSTFFGLRTDAREFFDENLFVGKIRRIFFQSLGLRLVRTAVSGLGGRDYKAARRSGASGGKKGWNW